ncbi:glycosyltransferase [Marinilabilia sp.]|uniref:glycosyltransferase n=1 Tax=Marinilabilia sp. TaxID=2021252 RepID=UPI0025BE3EBC|nr:glycosyltransferase [Marinilabilia sp.]
MRVLIVIESLRDGGKQRQVEELVRVLALNPKYRILVFILKDEIHFNRLLDMDRVEVKYLHRAHKKDPLVFARFYKEASKFRPDVINSWGGLPSMVALPFRILKGVPLVNEMVQNSRLPVFSTQWFRAKISFLFSNVIIGNSQIGMEVYKVPKAKGRLIRNGMNIDRIKKLNNHALVRREYHVSADKKIVGMVATIDWRKNFPMYLRAGIALLEKRRDVVFFVVGDGQDRAKLGEMIPDELKHFFVFTGRINDVEQVVNIFDVAVLASFGEGTSNSLLEYMVLRKPVVATDVFGINEVVREGVTGHLVPQDDFIRMGDKISELLDNPGLARKMGENGYEYVIKECSIEKLVSEHEVVFREVTGKA